MLCFDNFVFKIRKYNIIKNVSELFFSLLCLLQHTLQNLVLPHSILSVLLYGIVYIHLYSASHSMSISALILCRS